MRLLTAAIVLLCLGSSPHAKEISFEDFQAAVDARENEIKKFRAALNDSNPDRRLAAMEFMIASGDEALADMAKEVGLFSSDLRMQNAALRAIFDSAPALRIVVTGDEQILEWIDQNGGSHDGAQGFVIGNIGPWSAEENCWTWRNGSRCAIQLSGKHVELTGRNMGAAMTLGADGILRGKIRWFNKVGDCEIDLTE